jgi:hypothetical protein
MRRNAIFFVSVIFHCSRPWGNLDMISRRLLLPRHERQRQLIQHAAQNARCKTNCKNRGLPTVC